VASCGLLAGSAAHAQDNCAEAEIEARIRTVIEGSQPSGVAFRTAVGDGTNPAAALSKVASEPARSQFDACQVAVEGVLEHLGFPPLH
jgi:hypothetical protein